MWQSHGTYLLGIASAPQGPGSPPWTDVIQALSAAIQTVLVVAAAVYAYSQVAEARKSRSCSAAIYLADRLNDFEAAQRRRRLFRDIYPRIGNPTIEDESILGQIANEYHALGYLVKHELVDQELILALHYAAVIRAWTAMHPWIDIQRNTRGSKYADYFEHLYQLCQNYVAQRRPGETINVV